MWPDTDRTREWQLVEVVFRLVLVGFPSATFHVPAANYVFGAVTTAASTLATWAGYTVFVRTA